MHYEKLETFGLSYGDAFRNLLELRVSPHGVLGRVRSAENGVYCAHPAVLDSCLQIIGALAFEMAPQAGDLYLPTGIAECRLIGPLSATSGSIWSYGRINTEAPSTDEIGVDFLIFDGNGTLLAEFRRLQFRRVSRETWIGPELDVAANEKLLTKLVEADVSERMGLLNAEVADQVGRVLGHARGVSLDVRKPFNELGLDSITAVELTKSLSRTFGVPLPAAVLFTSSTVEALAVHIGQELRLLERTETQRRPIEDVLREDAVLDPSIRPALPVDIHAEPQSIFLTGATGFLGSELLRELLTQTYARIHCLVRGSDPASARERLIAKLVGAVDASVLERLSVVVGDLAEPYFNLTRDDYAILAAEVDSIFHCGAVVDVVAPYSVIKPPNVGATRQILHLACQGRGKPLHYVSTLSVFMSPKYIDADHVMEDDGLDDCSGYPAGYIQSKWVAEKLVAEAQSRGLPVVIYRPPVITGHSVTGDCKLDDVTPRMIKGCIQLGATPKLNRPALDFASVDYVSRAIVYIARNPECFGKAFHIKHKETLTWDNIAERMREFGYSIRETPYGAWVEALRKAPIDNPLTHFLSYFEETPEELLTLPPLDRSNTEMFLAGSSITDASINQLLGAYLRYFLSVGFINPI
jgi:thioester reductase-like protein